MADNSRVHQAAVATVASGDPRSQLYQTAVAVIASRPGPESRVHQSAVLVVATRPNFGKRRTYFAAGG